jgi:SUN domain-containing protein 1/2
MLAAPAVLVDEVTIDHVAKDVAYDLRSAPREMEVWGMVEGKENVERIRAWRESGDSASYESDVVYPPTLPKNPEYIRLVNFTYDVHAPNYVQTFAIDPRIRALDLDFGIVVLRVLSNWGMDTFTCLYRFRVHGNRLGSVSVPMADGLVSSSEGGGGVGVEETMR